MTALRTLARRGKHTKVGRRARRLAHLTFAAYLWTEEHAAPWFCRVCHHEPGDDRGEHAPWCRAPDWRPLLTGAA